MMNRFERKVLAGFLAAAIGFAPIAFAAAAETNGKPGKASKQTTKAPEIARVVVTPSAEQLAEIRQQRRMAGIEKRATVGKQAASERDGATGAL
ncbi:MAG: hypothetical protein D4R74_08585 [Betaproteobacteria bacterium]|nr:MAG: hypothetical protein D4R74_08585 [Betaproteobacteria bacterium]